MLRDLNLGYPTWISLSSWEMKTVMPFPRGDQVVILHAFVGFRKTRYQSNNVGLRLEVISRVGELMALIHMNDVMPRESQAHLLVESIYATQDPKQVRGALMGSQPMVDQIVLGHLTHRKCYSSFYESDHRNDNLSFLSICDYLVRSTIPQGYSLQNVILSSKTFHIGRRVYEVLELTHLVELKGKG